MVRLYEAGNVSLKLDELKVLETIKSDVQDISFYQHPSLGRVLVINGEIQHVEKWSSFYHEQLVHLPSSFIASLKDVLILGGGSLFAAAEALKYDSVEQVVLIDHDPTVLELMEKYYPHARQVLKDQRFKYLAADAKKIDFQKKSFDLIINDCFDLAEISFRPPGMSFTYLANFLKSDGLCSDVIYRHIFETETLRKSIIDIEHSSCFSYSLITIPEYPGILHLHVIWGKQNPLNLCQPPQNPEHSAHINGTKLFDFKLYEPAHRSFYLHLPPYIAKILKEIRIK